MSHSTQSEITVNELVDKLHRHETTKVGVDDDEAEDPHKTYEVDMDAVKGVDQLSTPTIVLTTLTDEVRLRLGAAASGDEGHFEVVVLKDERALLVFNRWYGVKLNGEAPTDVEDTNADTAVVEHMFSAFRRPFDDTDDMARRTVGSLEQLSHVGVVCTSTFNFIISLGPMAGFVLLMYTNESARSGIVALQIEFKRERNGRREPVSATQFDKCVKRARAAAERESERWRHAEPKLDVTAEGV